MWYVRHSENILLTRCFCPLSTLESRALSANLSGRHSFYLLQLSTLAVHFKHQIFIRLSRHIIHLTMLRPKCEKYTQLLPPEHAIMRRWLPKRINGCHVVGCRDAAAGSNEAAHPLTSKLYYVPAHTELGYSEAAHYGMNIHVTYRGQPAVSLLSAFDRNGIAKTQQALLLSSVLGSGGKVTNHAVTA